MTFGAKYIGVNFLSQETKNQGKPTSKSNLLLASMATVPLLLILASVCGGIRRVSATCKREQLFIFIIVENYILNIKNY